MSNEIDMKKWPEEIRKRYESYLKTSFFFSNSELRDSFQEALREGDSLLKVGTPERQSEFKLGINARTLAEKRFQGKAADLLPALHDYPLYMHQQEAIRLTDTNDKKDVTGKNVFVATGTASGKTESFLYPILFELYRQYLEKTLENSGVRAMILYPMNALANDQRERLGEIRKRLDDAGSGFKPTFGQYTGQTPENKGDRYRNAAARIEEARNGEIIFREQMRDNPPHILLTNYSMLEYLLIRPDDSPLFDDGRGKHWQFIVLDEAHQYRGAKGMEMGMLIRRLKQRLYDGGRRDSFQCIATSATISRKKKEDDEKANEGDKEAVADFAQELFGEPFSPPNIIFGEFKEPDSSKPPQRHHAFLRALEGAFLVYANGKSSVVLNRKHAEGEDGEPLEVALCRECGQHYYVGKNRGGELREAVRDPSQHDFGVEYYLPTDSGDKLLCRRCGRFSKQTPKCDCGASIPVKKCPSHKEHPDQLKECEVCGYRGGDPVHEIVHGSNGPNSVIVTALHELLPEGKRKILAFADSRQEAAFFAWYAEDSYNKLRDRNFLFRAINCNSDDVDEEGLSVDDVRNRLLKQWEKANLFEETDTSKMKNRKVLTSILREAVTSEKRLSLSGVGLIRWFVALPQGLNLPEFMQNPPWNFTKEESLALIGYLLDDVRSRRALNFPDSDEFPSWNDISDWPGSQPSFSITASSMLNVRRWGEPRSSIVKHFLYRLLEHSGLSENQKRSAAEGLMDAIWETLPKGSSRKLLTRATRSGTFRLDLSWVRVKSARMEEIWECGTCATISGYNIRNVCPRNNCPGTLSAVNQEVLKNNHYRKLYEIPELPSKLRAEEHTAQISTEIARERQDEFKKGDIHLLSSSTTFEVGVDLGNLESVFLRNVPPEPFNYTQRAGRAGRREGTPGLVLTYCRRNPHDLYHYENPDDRILKGEIRPPRLHMKNEKIILRHMVAVVFSSFFKEYKNKFKNVQEFIGDWQNPRGVNDLRAFCNNSKVLKESLRRIVPKDMHATVGLEDNLWIEKITGKGNRFNEGSRLEGAQAEVCADYTEMEKLYKECIEKEEFKNISRIKKRQNTISEEKTLNFLSRKAVIPKYGFPVDVVELDTRPTDNHSNNVVLQRDLSQAISEYAPGGKVVANKKEWKSYGLKMVADKGLHERYYRYDVARNFEQREKPFEDKSSKREECKYVVPKFGFVTPFFEKPSDPKRQTQRLYTTRPFFDGLQENLKPTYETTLFDIQVTRAVPGMLVILCEGKNRAGFFICRSCGAQVVDMKHPHRAPWGLDCSGELGHFSLGHELSTDVVRLQFPGLCDEWDAYSVAYAILLGAADTLEVLDTDLNVTITGGIQPDESAIVLYDNVPGGAGLVAQLEKKEILQEIIDSARERVQGGCKCDSSCYGCLRSYRNQFAHPHLDRKKALYFLKG